MSVKKIAVFTSQFPGKVSTFFSRDINMLINNGFNVDIFPIYPVRKNFWQWVPCEYRSNILAKTNIIYVSPINVQGNKPSVSADAKNILTKSKKFGISQTIKSLLVIRQAAAWSTFYDGKYDYMLSYWGNYAGTYAFLANKALTHKIPFSFFLHAGTDLYRDQIYLEEKIKYANHVITVCDFNKKFLKNLYPSSYDSFENKLVLYHLGVELEELPSNSENRDPSTLLTIGRMDPQKGFISVVKAMSLLISEFKDLRLVMIGEGPEKKRIIELARNTGVLDRIIFTGHLPFSEVKNYLAKSTILIHPSSDLGDAVPTVIKEAMAAGLPVIGSNLVGIPELLDYGNAGILFAPNDINQLASSIRKLLENPKLRTNYSRMGRNFAEEKFDMVKNSKVLFQQINL
jgi:colanic acid/amylovoran biosynthesis glycosyltransferase